MKRGIVLQFNMSYNPNKTLYLSAIVEILKEQLVFAISESGRPLQVSRFLRPYVVDLTFIRPVSENTITKNKHKTHCCEGWLVFVFLPFQTTLAICFCLQQWNFLDVYCLSLIEILNFHRNSVLHYQVFCAMEYSQN